MALQRAEMRMVRWICGVKLKDRLPSKELRERLGVDDIALVLQQNRLRWYGKMTMTAWRNVWSMKLRVQDQGEDQRRPGKRLYMRTVKHISWIEDAMDRCKWRKVIKEARWSGWVRVGECFFWYRPTRVVLDQRPLNGRCVPRPCGCNRMALSMCPDPCGTRRGSWFQAVLYRYRISAAYFVFMHCAN